MRFETLAIIDNGYITRSIALSAYPTLHGSEPANCSMVNILFLSMHPLSQTYNENLIKPPCDNSQLLSHKTLFLRAIIRTYRFGQRSQQQKLIMSIARAAQIFVTICLWSLINLQLLLEEQIIEDTALLGLEIESLSIVVDAFLFLQTLLYYINYLQWNSASHY